ncbi:hypothetical protein [Brucella rhizosphaerae]|uniref:hypothetical protein n=1 Tax=Brucella rhizosphaerae TaxID=571254 RepID=UPI0036070923
MSKTGGVHREENHHRIYRTSRGSALPAAAQTVNWNGSFGGASGAGSAVTGGFAFGAGSTAAGQAATTGWAEGKGTVVGLGGKIGHYGASAGIGSGYFTSGSGGQTAAMAQSGTGFLGGSSAGTAFGTTSGGSSGSISLRP